MMNQEIILDLFKEHQFDYQLHRHEPVFTVEASMHLHHSIGGAHSKNLFLKDKKKSFFLVSVLDHKRVDLKSLSKIFGTGGFSFGSAEELLAQLQLMPGSVTPLGLIHDHKKEILFLLDQDFLNFETVNFHPLRNDMTIEMPTQSFLRFLEVIHHSPHIIEIPTLK